MPERNTVSWNAMICAFAREGDFARALGLFRAMDLEGARPDRVTFVAILDACGQSLAMGLGMWIHAELLTAGFQGEITISTALTALVAMYGNFGHLREAKLVFDDLKHRDVKAWSSMLAAFALNGHSHEALEIFHAMQLHGFTPNSVTFVSVLLACAHAGLLSDVYSHFASLSADYAIAASLDHYMCVVDALARSGRLREAEDLIATMPFEPDAVAWTSLLSASTAAGDSHRARKAAEYVYELDPTNAAPYTLLSGLHLGPARNAASSSSSSSSYSSSRLSDHVTKTEDDSSCLSTLNFCQI
ncbi:hypothetical protein SELMODRAFT_122334 [Selaginella moellendorffii]|uniref:Pentacotripeptide-repeat region of PRORP domain-containing protein n=1 Tax=Selaginella moellendorffii TaxID=88036 RepID=D8SQG4_SELML|nr:hypothetical protein SELMODRAFT_122334 [Selaginella moellendorffii]